MPEVLPAVSGMPELLREEPLTAREIGRIGESIFEERARSFGFDVWTSQVDRGTDAVLSINGKFVRVQVKSTASKNLWMIQNKQAMPFCQGVSFVALVNIISRSVYVVPVSSIDRRRRTISEQRVQKYKDAWDLILSGDEHANDCEISQSSRVIGVAVELLSRRGIVCHLSQCNVPYHILADVGGTALRLKIVSASRKKDGGGWHASRVRGGPEEFDFLMAVDADSAVVFIKEAASEGWQRAAGAKGSFYMPKDCPSKNAWHLLEGSGTDATRTNDH